MPVLCSFLPRFYGMLSGDEAPHPSGPFAVGAFLSLLSGEIELKTDESAIGAGFYLLIVKFHALNSLKIVRRHILPYYGL